MSNYYRYVVYDSSRIGFNSVSIDNAANYGSTFIQNYPLTSSINTIFYPDSTNPSSSLYNNSDTDRIRIKSLKATFEKYKKYTFLSEYDSTYASYESDDITLINIPSIFYGQSLEKGSVKLSIFCDGVLLSKIEDIGKNGELIQTTGSVPLGNNRQAAGIVFYDEGIILLFDSTALANYTEQFYSTNDNPLTNLDYPRWNTWGISLHAKENAIVRTSYDIDFNGVNKIPQLTMLAHANVAELNNSNNKTYLKKDQVVTTFITSSNQVRENDSIQIKNIVKTPYVSPEPEFHKETYISKILIYDKEKNVIGIAKLATPIRKTEDRSFTFKLKLNL